MGSKTSKASATGNTPTIVPKPSPSAIPTSDLGRNIDIDESFSPPILPDQAEAGATADAIDELPIEKAQKKENFDDYQPDVNEADQTDEDKGLKKDSDERASAIPEDVRNVDDISPDSPPFTTAKAAANITASVASIEEKLDRSAPASLAEKKEDENNNDIASARKSESVDRASIASIEITKPPSSTFARIMRTSQKIEIIRNDPLVTADMVYDSREAMLRVIGAIRIRHPGSDNRWQRMLTDINSEIEPTEEQPDPARININHTELRQLLSRIYRDTITSESGSFPIMREYMPKIFEGHTAEHAKLVSQKERESRGLKDECYAYGELDYETFASIFIKVTTAYGPVFGDFVDLGCGVGTIVYTAAFLGNFTTCVGIEKIHALCDRGKKRLPRWNRASHKLPEKMREVQFEWIEADFTESTSWKNNVSFAFLHWTAFSSLQRAQVNKILSQCPIGTLCVSLTTPLAEFTGFEVLEDGVCDTSWGQATFYVHEKMT